MTLVRFAPSPTGYLHIGNARPALLNALFARRHGGRFLLRLDDTDAARSTEAFAQAIREDLSWLGIDPDLFARQSERKADHDAAAAQLKAAGRLYPCYETPEELERRRKRQLGRGQPPIYDRAALKLTPEERAAYEAEGRTPHWRFLLEARTVTWDDLVRGPAHVDCASLSDPVLIRGDGSYLYTLPSVVDDRDFGITHIIRGEDHVTNTGVQVQIFEALGAAVPVFGTTTSSPPPTGRASRSGSAICRCAACARPGSSPAPCARWRCSPARPNRCARWRVWTSWPPWWTCRRFPEPRPGSTRPNSMS